MSTFAMHVAKTGLNSQQIKMQVIANNLANVNTSGFKADRTNFESLLYQILRGAGDNTSENHISNPRELQFAQHLYNNWLYASICKKLLI